MDIDHNNKSKKHKKNKKAPKRRRSTAESGVKSAKVVRIEPMNGNSGFDQAENDASTVGRALENLLPQVVNINVNTSNVSSFRYLVSSQIG